MKNHSKFACRIFFHLALQAAFLISGLSLGESQTPRSSVQGTSIDSVVQLHPNDPHRLSVGGNTLFVAGYYPSIATFILGDQPDPAYYKLYFDDLAKKGVNYVRATLTMGQPYKWSVVPYRRTGPGRAADGGLKFDLTQFDDSFFEHWRNIINYARSKNIVLQLTIFDAWHNKRDVVQDGGSPTATWGMNFDFYRGPNNVNGVDTPNVNVWTNPDNPVFGHQKMFICRVVDSLGDLPNIVFEICNENYYNDGWELQLANYLSDYERRTGKPRHLVMPRDLPNHDHVGAKDDQTPAYAHAHLVANFNQNKPLIDDNDGGSADMAPDQVRRRAWAALTAGAHISLLDDSTYLVENFNSTAAQARRKYLGLTTKFLGELNVNLVGMQPHDDLVSNGAWALARPGEEYVIYLPNGNQTSVDQLPPNFAARWFNPRTGITSEAFANRATFYSPSGDDWVLYIKEKIPSPQPDVIDLVNAPNGSWFLAEGYSSGAPLHFRTDYSISNPNPDEVTVRVYFGDERGQAFSTQFPVKAHSKRVIRLSELIGMGAYSSVFQSLTHGSQIYVEREMKWSLNRAGHASTAVRARALRWYFAEGSTAGRGYFQNYFLAFNPSPSVAAELRVTYLRDRGSPVVRYYRINPQQRLTLLANAEPELADLSFGAVLESTNGVPILAERSMYWGPGWSSTPAATRPGGTNGMGASELSATWFFAEGAVFPVFDTYYLILNPNPSPTTVRVRYLGEGGEIGVRNYDVAANSRYTIDLRNENLDGKWGNVGGVSAEVTALDGSLIVAERATYRGNHPEWADGAVALGSNRGALKWHLPAERTTGDYDTFLLVMNQNAFDLTVRLTMNREDGKQVQSTWVLRAGTRTTFGLRDAGKFPDLANQSFSTVVESLTPGGEISAEHAVYWLPEAGVIWQGGQGSAGIPE